MLIPVALATWRKVKPNLSRTVFNRLTTRGSLQRGAGASGFIWLAVIMLIHLWLQPDAGEQQFVFVSRAQLEAVVVIVRPVLGAAPGAAIDAA